MTTTERDPQGTWSGWCLVAEVTHNDAGHDDCTYPQCGCRCHDTDDAQDTP